MKVGFIKGRLFLGWVYSWLGFIQVGFIKVDRWVYLGRGYLRRGYLRKGYLRLGYEGRVIYCKGLLLWGLLRLEV